MKKLLLMELPSLEAVPNKGRCKRLALPFYKYGCDHKLHTIGKPAPTVFCVFFSSRVAKDSFFYKYYILCLFEYRNIPTTTTTYNGLMMDHHNRGPAAVKFQHVYF